VCSGRLSLMVTAASSCTAQSLCLPKNNAGKKYLLFF
jgi:hypothetical protein